MKVFRKFIKAVAFVLAFLVLFGAVSGVLVCPNDYRNYQWEYTPDNPFLASDILTDYPIAERYTKAQVPMYQAVPTPSAIYRRYCKVYDKYVVPGLLISLNVSH